VKWLVAVLLFLNIAVFMWGSWYKSVPPGVVVKARPPVNADTIRPLRPLAALQDGRLCVSVGPFASEDQASTALTTAERLGVSNASPEHRVETATSYRVYLPSLPSRKLAERKRAQLTELGFKEHYIIDEPDRENAVSLGVFAVEKNAAALVRALAEKGVSARQEALTNAQTTYWLKGEIHRKQLSRLRQQGWSDARARLSWEACSQDAATAGRAAGAAGPRP
jgi:hypothetical protein